LRFKIYTAIIILSVIVVCLSLYYGQKSINAVIQQKAYDLFENRIKEYNVFYQDKKIFLDSFAKFLSSSPTVIKAYLENNRSMLINYVKPLYDNLYPSHIIEEIHFFKKPAISFVNFANLKKHDFSVAKARADIVWINTSFAPSNHFYVCRLYPGLRATYPIIYKDRLLGSLSFGININVFKNLFQKVGAKDVSIYLNDKILKKMLLPAKYSFYKNLPEYKGFRILGNKFNGITLKEGYEIKNHCVYTKIKIIDFFKNTMAYLIIRDDVSNSINTLNSILKEKMAIEIFGFLIVFAIIFVLFKWLFDKMKEINNILSLIKTQNFSKIPQKTVPKDELDEYKNNLIDVANTIKTYINLLTKKVEEYSDKAYKDGLTHIFNRRFLEEKAQELFIKFNITNTQVGIIMLDIDNFKQINDAYGHDIGDLILIKLAETIKKEIRKEDLFIRYGGEEFLLILLNSNLQNTYKVAEKIRKAIESLEIDIGEKHIKFTISLGVSEINRFDENIYDAIKRADINLYKAKKNGKNRVEL
jgi:diguanylate cyclase (GGDEF)-like protein